MNEYNKISKFLPKYIQHTLIIIYIIADESTEIIIYSIKIHNLYGIVW